MRDLSKLRTAYEMGAEPLRAIAERFAVPFDTLKKRAAREKWHRHNDRGDLSDAENGTQNGISDRSAGIIKKTPANPYKPGLFFHWKSNGDRTAHPCAM